MFVCYAHSDLIAKHEVRVRALGDLRRLPDDVLQFIAKGVNYSKHNSRYVFACACVCVCVYVCVCVVTPPPVIHAPFAPRSAYLNVCYAYTSRHEMTEAIKELATGAQDGLLYPR